MKINTIIILAGGEGTRLKPILKHAPKPMIDVYNKPLLEHILELIEKKNPTKVIIAIGYKAGKIIEHFNKIKKRFSFELVYSIEKTPLGTGGAIKQALLNCTNEKNILVINGDSLFVVDLNKMYEQHNKHNSLVTMGTTFVDDVSASGAIKLSGNIVTEFIEKPKTKKSGNINAGIYLINIRILNKFPKEEKFSFERDFLEKEVVNHTIFGYPIDEFYTVNNPLQYAQLLENLKDRHLI